MKKLEKIDNEKSIETYPGYLGHIWESEYEHVDLITELNCLKNILWNRYETLVGETDDPIRHLSIKFSRKPDKQLISFDASRDALANVLDCIPSIEVKFDDFSDDPNISGYAHIFFIKNGFKLLEVIDDIKNLIEAVLSDYQYLEDQS